MRPARRFTGKGRWDLPGGLQGKGDETCQEVYGKREMLHGWRAASRFTGKGGWDLPGGLREKEMLHGYHGELPEVHGKRHAAWLPQKDARRFTGKGRWDLPGGFSKCQRTISVGARPGDNVKMVQKKFTSENVL
jgi:hypothetical protein